MSAILQFQLTGSGNKAVWNANNNGLSLDLTHIQVGSGNREPTGQETALSSPKDYAPIASGFQVSDKQIRMSAIFTGTGRYTIREVGIWAGHPELPDSVLVCYWSQADGDLAEKSPGCDFVLTHDMMLDASVPNGGLTIIGDSAASAMLMAHEMKSNPHPQYMTELTGRALISALIEARVGDYVISSNVGNAYTVVLDPPATEYTTKTGFAFKASATNTGPATINAGAGALAVLRDDATPLAAGDIEAGAVCTVVYDATEHVFRMTGVVASQIDELLRSYAAPLMSPALKGMPTTPTPALGAPGEQIVNAEYVDKAMAANKAQALTLSFAGSQTLEKDVFTILTLGPSSVDNELFSWSNGVFTVKKSGVYRFASHLHFAVSQTSGLCSFVSSHIYTLGAGNSTVFDPAPSTYVNNQPATVYVAPGGSSGGNSVFDIKTEGTTPMKAGDKFSIRVFTDSNAPTFRAIGNTSIGKQMLVVQYLGG